MSQVTDYNIANASGASVRTDLNLVFDAIKTLNSGGSDPANTAAFMPFVDTGDSNKLKIRNSSNNGFTTIGPVDTPNLGLLAATGGTMTGVLQLPVGSATAPSINFGQTNTGIFKGASHRVSVTSDGTQVFFADGTGVNINSTKELRWKDSDNSNYIGFKAANNITNNLTLTLPTADGSSGQALLTNGSGTLSFGAPTVGAANLTGNTLASGVTASSLTSVGTLSSLNVSGTCTATTFSGSGASLTDVPAEQLTGTVADARISSLTASKLSGALPAISGANLTNLPTAGANKPAWYGIKTSNAYMSEDTPYTITHFTDQGSYAENGFNASSGVFTVPSGKGGFYFVTAGVTLNTLSDAESFYIYFKKNGSAVNPKQYNEHIAYNDDENLGVTSANITSFIDLANGDTIEIAVYRTMRSGSNAYVIEGTYFGGFKLNV